MSKYEVLSRLSNYQYIYNCPVFITGGNILKDTTTNEIYINLKYRSRSNKNIKAVIISVDCYDIEKEKLPSVNKCIYQDFIISFGDFFGEEKCILCPDANTRSCKVNIKKVIFYSENDEDCWVNSDDLQVTSLGLQTRISDWPMTNLKKVLYDELKQINYSKNNAIYLPSKFDDGWICTCGMVNFDTPSCLCGMRSVNLFKIFNEKYLEEQLSAFEEKVRKKSEEDIKRRKALKEQEEKELEEKRKVEEIRRKLQEEDIELERKKKTKMLILWAIVVAVILSIIISFILLGNYDENQETVIFDADNSVSLTDMQENTSVAPNETIVDKSLYEYYDLLNEAWDGSQTCRTISYYKFYIDNDKIYFINTNPDNNVGTNDGYTWNSYDINTKEYKKIFNAKEPIFMSDPNIYVRIYDSWYYNKAFYAVYECSSYEINNYYRYYCIIKMDDNGKILRRVLFDESTPINIAGVVNGLLIIKHHEKGNYESTLYDVYSSNLKLLATLTRPLKPLAHGLSEPVYVSSLFGYGGNVYAIADQRFYIMNIEDAKWADVNIIEKPTGGFGKYSISANDRCIIDVKTGEKIYEGYLTQDYSDDYFGNTYFGENYNIVLHDGYWYKVRYPNGECVDFTKYEPMGIESARYQDNIVQLNETYYIFKDKYGVFLRTYEKGETQEETILSFVDNSK